ncbi:uncharacterized protein LOC143923390 isoform X7 [Lithobates pipiens]
MTGKGVDKMSEIEKQMCSKLSQIRQILKETPGLLCSPGQQVQNGGSINKQGPEHKVGIFSMEVMDPGWLEAALNSRFFNRSVYEIKYTISNDKKKRDSISESTFCIFFTDQFTWNVTSISEKGQALKEFGSKPHIVVIDDADDSGDAKKKKLLNDLILSKIYIKDLFLFSKLEKECDFMTYLNADEQTDSMPIGKVCDGFHSYLMTFSGVDALTMVPVIPDQYRHVDIAHATHMMDPPVLSPAMPDQDRHVSTQHVATMMVDTLTMVPATPDQYRHVNTAHATHTMGPLVPIQAVPNQDKHVNPAPAAYIIDTLTMVPATPDQYRHVNTAHATHTMGPLVPIQAVPNQDRHGNPAPAAYIIGVDTLAPFPATAKLKKPVSSFHAAHTADKYKNQYPPVLAPAMPDQDRHVSTQHVATMMDTLTMVPATPDQYRHVNTAHATHTMGPLVPIQAVPNQDRHGNPAPAAYIIGVDTLAPFPATTKLKKPVSSFHAAHTADKYKNQYPPVLAPAMPDQDRHVSTQHVATMMDTLTMVPATPDQYRHVNTAHATHTMGPLVPIQAVPNQDKHVNPAPAAYIIGVDTLAPFPATTKLKKPVSSFHAAHTVDKYKNQYPPVLAPAMPDQDRHVSTQHVATMMGVNILAPLPATLNLDRPVSSHHAAHPTASTIKEGHGNNSNPAHTMGEELLVAISPTSSHDRFNNSSCPTQIAGKDLLLSIPSIARQRRCAKTSSPANVMGEYNNQELKTNISPKQQPGKKHSVGIFSRSSDEDYSWLVELLTSENFRNSIQDVKPCYISNNGFQRFIDDLSECTLGILYHTKNRGRVNITNVNDSLYDEELGYLEQMLGKDNVIVVIDDLEDSSDQEKKRILENQPSIKSLASDLLLISRMEKAEKMQLVEKLKSLNQLHHP